MFVPEAEFKDMVAGMSVGKTTLKMQLASIGRFKEKPTVSEDISFTVVTVSALTKVGVKSVAKSVAVIERAPVWSIRLPEAVSIMVTWKPVLVIPL
jgi:hypothetical protein